ncbi:MAG: hypothetical protein JO316_02080 [Abitibacteriaceae bacterium]|nr:hypothetical protein [Abditibacteriaceae bacterium]
MVIPILPASAPFTSEQRAWLNGFLAGLVALDNSAAPTSGHGANGASSNGVAAAAITTNGVTPAPVAGASAADEDEDFAWHDPNLEISERLQLAEGKPIQLKLMAAMAQLDCGQCGYLCKTYAEAIANGEEKSLNKCVPGGKETSKKLKELVAAP